MTDKQAQKKIAARAMTVSLNISQWSGSKYDKGASEETRRRFNAGERSGNFNKRLLDSEEFKAVRSAKNALSKYFKEKTSPWTEAVRILRNEDYMEFISGLRSHIEDYNQAADEFAAVYESQVQQMASSEHLGDMWNKDDYPSADEIRDKFAAKYEVMPFPDADDFRASLGNSEEEEKIRADIERNIQERLENGRRDVFERISKVVSVMINNLEKYKPNGGKGTGLRQSMIENIEEIADLIPTLNITNDKRIDALGKELKQKLCWLDASELADDKQARKDVAKDAKAILEKVSGFIA